MQAHELFHRLSESKLENSSEMRAVLLAEEILRLAIEETSSKEAKVQHELGRMMDDPAGKYFTTALTDECFRTSDHQRAADQIRYLLQTVGIPKYVSFDKKIALSLFKYLGSLFPFIFVPLTKYFLREETRSLIMPGEEKELLEHIQKRTGEGVRINLNHLGEAILGEEEAQRRLQVYLEDLKNPFIEYVSIKISTLYSQINLLAMEETLKVLEDRYVKLLHAAKNNTFKNKKGELAPKFVNLDMEEYRDLRLTVALFKRALDRKDCFDISAGIVLQAYLPDSFIIQKDLTEWAEKRVREGGAPIKIRLVKGANLAMEKVESSLKGWELAPYDKKSEVDANFKRMLNYGLKHAKAVHLGVGSHNLFDIAYALVEVHDKELAPYVTFEMLEGMAEPIRRVVQRLSEDTLLYCPAAKKEEFQNAVAYLVRRLDENTAPDNFLRHAFNLKPGSKAFSEQKELFLEACRNQNEVKAGPKRKQNRQKADRKDLNFQNEPDTDLSLSQNQEWALNIYRNWESKKIDPIPLVIDGEVLLTKTALGFDPSRVGFTFEYHVAESLEIEKALVCASRKYPEDDLSKVGDFLRQRRADLIGAMILNTAKSFQEADAEVSEAIDFADYYLALKREIDLIKDTKFSPKGACLIAPPWNFSVSIPLGGIIAALHAGNNVIFKPAKEAVLAGWILAETLWEAGVSRKRLQFLVSEDEPYGSTLVKDPRIDLIVLTGSTETARLLQKIQDGNKLIAETGGKNAMIVSNLSDHDLAIKDIVQSAFGYSGQKCSALSQLILHEELYNSPQFKKQLLDATKSLTVGSAWNLKAKITPLINPPSPHLLKALTTLEEGEEWLLKPEPGDHPRLWSPGIKWGVKPGSFSHVTEFFGPILSVLPMKTLEEGVKIANQVSYGLTSGIHSLDAREIEYWKNHIEAGNLYVNRTVTGAIVQRQPFGGTKESSYGFGFKAGGPNYLFPFMKMEAKGENNTYQFFYNSYFSRKHDPSRLLGQDNFLYYVPHKKVYFYSTDPEEHKIIKEISELTRTPIDILGGSEEEFAHAVPLRARVRSTKPFSKKILSLLNQKYCIINLSPLLSNGRIELLNYLREVTLSYDYHRYGNLGLREFSECTPSCKGEGRCRQKC